MERFCKKTCKYLLWQHNPLQPARVPPANQSMLSDDEEDQALRTFEDKLSCLISALHAVGQTKRDADNHLLQARRLHDEFVSATLFERQHLLEIQQDSDNRKAELCIGLNMDHTTEDFFEAIRVCDQDCADVQAKLAFMDERCEALDNAVSTAIQNRDEANNAVELKLIELSELLHES